MPMNTADDVHIIVRHLTERTKELCFDILAKQVPVDCISAVSAAPFSAMLRQCFERAIDEHKTWTICIDADVLPGENCIKTLVSIAEAAPDHIFEAQGLVIDKTFGVARPAGNHIYRTSLLPQAIRYLDANVDSLRPESATVWAMAREGGNRWWQDETIVGLHDFGQYYRDLIRKIMVQYHKFPAQQEKMEAYFEEKAASGDEDYLVALRAVEYCKESLNDTVKVDANWSKAHVDIVMEKYATAEKPPISPAEAGELCALLDKQAGRKITEEDMAFIGQIGLR